MRLDAERCLAAALEGRGAVALDDEDGSIGGLGGLLQGLLQGLLDAIAMDSQKHEHVLKFIAKRVTDA